MKIIDRLGGQAAAARACGVDRRAVGNWVARGSIPYAHVWKLMRQASTDGVMVTWRDFAPDVVLEADDAQIKGTRHD